MPVTPSQIRRAIIREHTIDFGDGVVVTFRFDRNHITDSWLSAWTQNETSGNTNAINGALAELIHGWDVVNDDGTEFPPTAENIGYLFSLSDKGTIVRELMQATVPGEAEGKASSVPSPTPASASTEPLPTSPNGQAPSPSPALSASQ